MIVYCSLPVRGENLKKDFYQVIVELIKGLKHTALTELNPDFKPAAPLTDSEIFSRDMKWLDKSKLLIAEVSGASTGVGFEIAYALYKLKMPVLALANSDSADRVSAMINGCHDKLLTLSWYEDENDLKKRIKDFLAKNEK